MNDESQIRHKHKRYDEAFKRQAVELWLASARNEQAGHERKASARVPSCLNGSTPDLVARSLWLSTRMECSANKYHVEQREQELLIAGLDWRSRTIGSHLRHVHIHCFRLETPLTLGIRVYKLPS